MGLLDSFETVATRCATIIDNVVKWERTFNTDETPGIAVYLGGPIVVEDSNGFGNKDISIPIDVAYYKEATTDNPTAEGAAMLEALLAAVEIDDPNGGCSFVVGGTMDIVTPPDNGGIISVRVAFSTTKYLSYGGV